MPPRKRLGQLLTEMKIVDEHQLQSALGHQKQWGGKLGAILVQKGFCREDQVVAALSEHLAMPAVRLAEVKVDARAVKMVSKSVAERLHVFAYEVSGSGRSEVITIAMSDPTDLSAVDQLAFHTGKRIKPVLAGDSEVLAFIQQYYAPEKPAQPAPAPGARPFVDGAKAPGAAARTTPAAIPAVAAAAGMAPGSRPAAATSPAAQQAMPPPPPPPPPEAGQEAAASVEPLTIEGGDLPSDAPMDGLEPIAAHAQGETSVEGAEAVPAGDVAGANDEPVPLEDPSALQGWAEGTAEGVTLETANPMVVAVPPAEGGWSEAQQAADSGWAAAPVAPESGWGEATAAPIADQGADELPIDAIMGTADVLERPADDAPVPVDDATASGEAPVDAGSSLDAPDAWSDISDPLAVGGNGAEDGTGASNGEAAEASGASRGAPEDGAARSDSDWEAAAAAIEAAAEEEQRSDEFTEVASSGDESMEQSARDPEPTDSLLAPPDDSPVPADEVSIDTENWSDDSAVPAPAGESAGFSMSSPAEDDTEASFDIDAEEGGSERAEPVAYDDDRPATQRYGWILRHEQQEQEGAQDFDAAAESQQEGYEQQPEYAEEQTGYGEQPPDESAPGEGWTAPVEPDAQQGAWFGEALSSTTPLSPADLGTLAALGLDPADGAAAQRMLACLVRVLNRRQAIDLEELAAEIRESRMAAEAHGGDEQSATDEAAADPESSAEPADDPV
jgi:hypothetical protein